MPFLRAIHRWACALPIGLASLGADASALYGLMPAPCVTPWTTGCDAVVDGYPVPGLTEHDDLALAIGALVAAGWATWRRKAEM